LIGVGILLTAPGCAEEVSFASDEPNARIRAIQQAAAEDDHSAIPSLITLLDSDDPAQRMLSINTLQKFTGETLGYDYAAPEYQRAPAVQRWRDRYAASPATAAGKPSTTP
jgi:HEAT repeat protein